MRTLRSGYVSTLPSIQWFIPLFPTECSAMMMANLIEGRDIDEDSAGPGDGALVVSNSPE